MAQPPALKSVRRILAAPSRHWVGDGFHVFPVFHDLAFSEEVQCARAQPLQLVPVGRICLLDRLLGIVALPLPRGPRGRRGNPTSLMSCFIRAQLSPFLMFDYASPKHFGPTRKRRGVGQHPHRGFETVTLAFQGGT